MTSAMPELSRPSPLRVGLGSAVISAHVVVLMMMSLATPGRYELSGRMVSHPIDIQFITRPPAPLAPPPPMPAVPPRARITPQPVAVPTPVPVVQAESVFQIDASVAVNAVIDEVASSGVEEDESDAPQADAELASLALLRAPQPPYPARAKRMGWQGEVVLRIHVGADGFPREVDIVRSSGHAELDRSARNHVLRQWRFAPPQREAIGEVPIRFALL